MEAIHGSKNGLYMRVIIGHTWKQEWAIHGSYTRIVGIVSNNYRVRYTVIL